MYDYLQFIVPLTKSYLVCELFLLHDIFETTLCLVLHWVGLDYFELYQINYIKWNNGLLVTQARQCLICIGNTQLCLTYITFTLCGHFYIEHRYKHVVLFLNSNIAFWYPFVKIVSILTSMPVCYRPKAIFKKLRIK